MAANESVSSSTTTTGTPSDLMTVATAAGAAVVEVFVKMKPTFNELDGLDQETLTGFDYSIISLLLLVSVGIGLFYAWKDRNQQEESYLMGGREMKVVPSAMSLVATFIPSTAVLGFPVEVYFRGASIIWVCVAIPVAILVASQIFVPVLYQMKVTSVNEYFKLRFNSELAMVIASITTMVTLIPNLALNLYYPGLAIAAVTDMSEEASVILCGLLCTAYTSFGGLKAVIWTDFVQYSIIMLSLVIICIKGTVDVGSMVEVFHRNDLGGRLDVTQSRIDLHSPTSMWNMLTGWLAVATAFLSFNQMQIQRTCCMPSLKDAKAVMYWGGAGFVIICLVLIYCGLVMFANYSHCDPIMSGRLPKPDQLMPYFVTQKLGKDIDGLPGLFVAGALAASLSTLSSGINAIAAFGWEDFGKKYLSAYVPEEKKMLAIKLIGVAVGLLTTGVALGSGKIGSAYEAAIVLSGSAAGPLFVAFLLGTCVPFANAWGAIAGMLSGIGLSALIIIGSMIEKRDLRTTMLPLSTEDCPWPNITTYFHFKDFKAYQLPIYHPTGMDRLFHITLPVVPAIGIATAVFFGVIVSLLTGGDKGRPVDPRFMLPIVNRWRGIEALHDQELQTNCISLSSATAPDSKLMYPSVGVGSGDAVRNRMIRTPGDQDDAGFEEREQF